MPRRTKWTRIIILDQVDFFITRQKDIPKVLFLSEGGFGNSGKIIKGYKLGRLEP